MEHHQASITHNIGLVKKKKIENEVMTKPTTAGCPPRALTSYNLFYRFKRFKILQALEADNNFSEEERSKQIVTAIVAATPGLESYGNDVSSSSDVNDSDSIKNLRRNEIHAVFHHDNLSPKKRIRDGLLGSLINTHELTRLISASWKDLDIFSRSIFDELANESKLIYRKRFAKYETSTAATAATDKAMALSVEAAENLINSAMALGSTNRSVDGNAKASIMVTTATTDNATATVEADLDKLAEAAANNIMASINVKAAGPSPEAMSLPNLLKNDTATSTS